MGDDSSSALSAERGAAVSRDSLRPGAASPLGDELALLVRRLRAGIEREDGARRLDALLRPRLLRYFRAGSFSDSEAEDLVQETLLRVFQHVGSLREEERFLHWLFTIARNLARSAGCRRGRDPGRGAQELDPEQHPGGTRADSRGEARERLTLVEEAIRTLPEQQRRCLVLAARDEMSYQEVADLMHLSPRTVRNHLAAARRRLRSLLEGSERT